MKINERALQAARHNIRFFILYLIVFLFSAILHAKWGLYVKYIESNFTSKNLAMLWIFIAFLMNIFCLKKHVYSFTNNKLTSLAIFFVASTVLAIIWFYSSYLFGVFIYFLFGGMLR